MVRTVGNYWADWGGYALVHFRGAYLEVDLDDMLPANRLLEVLGRDGALRGHLPSTKFLMRYLVGPQTLISLSENEKRNSEP